LGFFSQPKLRINIGVFCMNAGIYRLVFNAARGLWMVVGELVPACRSGRGGSRMRKARQFKNRALVLTLLSAAMSAQAGTLAPNTIPTGLTVTTGSHTTINAPVVNPLNTAGQLLTIQQADTKAILQGSNFNIGSASQVLFNHTGGAGSATLVRINGGATTIEGTVNSPNGDLYLINQNGILFGNGARVNVHGLVASALNIKDSDFLNDLGHLYSYTDGGRPAYSWGGDAAGFATSLVQLAPDARIKTALGGSVMLFAPHVINQGSIETTEGQVALAAGAKVYLSYAPDHAKKIPNVAEDTNTYSYADDSPYRALAGVLVEVDSYQIKDADGLVTTDVKGTVTNDVSGRILAQRGNITMASFMVNQLGRVIATTSVTQKGSIRLLARDTIDEPLTTVYNQKHEASNINVISASRAGDLVFGENSETLILPEHEAGAALAKQHLSASQTGEPTPQSGEKSFLNTVVDALVDSGNTVIDDQDFNAPTLEAIGRNITLQDGSSIVAPGAYINLSAQVSGDVPNSGTKAQPGTRLYLGKNTLIDASGLKDVAVSSDRNFVEVLLTSNDLQDDPLNKNGFLYHKNVWFDIRNLPNSGVANLAGYIKQIPRTIGEKLTVAGTVKLNSEGDLVQRTGSVVDVSGGSLKYTAGTHKETWLVDANGKAYALSSAPTGVAFTGFLGSSNFIQTQEAAYTQGMAAGTITLYSVANALDGQFKGATTYGDYQRSSANLGGSLTLNLGNADLDILEKPGILVDSFTASDALPAANASKVTLDTAMLNSCGFENLSLNTGGYIHDTAALTLAVGSKLSLTGANIAILDNIVARGGKVTLTGSTVTQGSGAQIDVSGLWVNDYLNPAAASGRALIKGGEVNISANSNVSTGQGSLIDVSGGGWLKSSGKVSNGDAGSISIGMQIGTVAPVLNGELRGYALGVGGSLSLTAPFVTIGTSGLGDASELWLTPAFFQNGGFTSYNLTGRDGVLVRSGTQVTVAAQNYQLNNNYVLAKTGGHVADFAKTVWLADYLRSSTILTLATQKGVTFPFAASGISRGSVVVQTGATLQVDAHGNRTDSTGNPVAPRIELSGWDNLVYVDGTLRADGGTIALNMKGVPSAADDSDFNASQAIWLGKNASLQAAGYAQLIPGSTGLRAGSVYNGGTISLNAQKGYVVAETGSQVNVSGGSATLDILSRRVWRPTTVASNGGSINLFVREGMLLDATLQTAAPGALGGNLNIYLGRGTTSAINLNPAHYPGYDLINDNYLPDQKWIIDVTQGSGAGFSNGLHAGDSVQAAAGGVARVAADSINSSGFSKATLKSESSVRFDGDVTLNLDRSLRLDAPVIEGSGSAHVTLNAPNVMLSNAQLSAADVAVRTSDKYIAPAPVSGLAALTINAQLLDLRGQLSLSGFATSNLNSTGDIRLTGFSNTDSAPVGELRTTGTLNMNARQIYPTSASAYTLSVEGAGGRAVFSGTGSHDTVLSAGGTLTVNAETITQGGVLLAPFGTIALNASQNLTLANNSLTSVSANGATIPFGYTSRDGLDYLYSFGTGTAVTSLTAPPEKVVRLNAPNVTQAAGSVVDVSSGGDLYAYEWIPGTGGSTDVLANGAKQSAFNVAGSTASNTWAIMPASNGTYASFDPQYWNGSGIQAGDAVYLSAAPGLAAGYYTLLPARYALLPGAMLVSAVSGHQDMSAGQVLAQNDGSTMVAGNLAAYTSNGYVATSRSGGFVVRAGSAAHTLAEYKDTLASSRYANDNNVMKTVDAGRFSVSATNSLILNGVLQALHEQTTGRGAEVDVAAPNLLVVDHGAQTGAVTVGGQTYLAVDENTLTGMNAASLLLGGTRSNGTVNVVSAEVRFGANASVSGPEVILAATDKVLLQGSATLSGLGSGAAARDLSIGSSSVSGNGALLRVAGGGKINLMRNNTDRTRGDLVVEAGATVHGDGAIQLDATRGMSVGGALEFGSGAALSVAAGRISFGTPAKVAQVTDGLWLTQSQLAPLQQAGNLTLQSYTTIDLYGAVNVGNENLDLTLQSAGVAGYQNAGQSAVITARNFTLNNANSVAFTGATALSDASTPALGSGNLNVNAQTISSGANTVRVAGFDQVKLTASGDIIAQGSGALVADKALTLAAARVSAQTGADHSLTATDGQLKLEGNGTLAAPAATKSQGANLLLQGTSVLLANAANIDAPGASVTVRASGANSTDNVTLQSGSNMLAQGSAYTLQDQSVALPAGKVTLVSAKGNVDMQAGAVIDLSPATGGTAGTLNVSAVNGNASLAGTVHGGNQAVATVDAGSTNNFSQLLGTLQEFSGAQSYRLRTGDAAIAAADNVATSHFVLTADNGAITVAGKVDASGDKGGSIEMYAKNDLVVNRGAQLLAKGLADKQSTAGTTGNGGKVVLASDSGIVSAQADNLNGVSGALIDVTGDQVGSIHGAGGSVILRAARSGGGTGVNVNTTTTAAVTGAASVAVEAVQVYDSNVIDTELQNKIASETNTFAAYMAAHPPGFSLTRDGVSASLTPGVEVSSSGDMTLSNDWVIRTETPKMTGGGILTLRATGNLLLNNNLAYEQYLLGYKTVTALAGSWSYRLIAGADASSANPEAVQAVAANQSATENEVASIQLAKEKYVRTGSGFIDAVAGQDIILGANSAIYTEGTPDTTAITGFSPLTNYGIKSYLELYPINGGEIHLNALGNITGKAGTSQTANTWLFRAALPKSDAWNNPQARWWPMFNLPSQWNPPDAATALLPNALLVDGVGALGGGDVSVNAGGNISNLQFASASNGRMGGNKTLSPDNANLTVNGGGDVHVIAGGDIVNALLVAGKGEADIQAGKSANVKFELMDASAKAYADGSVTIAQVSNPTITPSVVTPDGDLRHIFFYSYGKESAVNAMSASGDVTLIGNTVYPGTLYAAAPNGNVLTTGLVLYPSATGNATLIAGNDLKVELIMSDVAPATLQQASTTIAFDGTGSVPDLSAYVGSAAHAPGLLHVADTAPARFYAGNDVNFDPNTTVVLPKTVEVYAGHDVVDPNLVVQNNRATDVSIIQAGGSIRYSDPVKNIDGSIIASAATLQVAGPGRLQLVAGKSIDLGSAEGVRSVGDLYDPYLSAQGADIMVRTGAAGGINYTPMIAGYLDPLTAGEMAAVYLPQLVSYLENRSGVSGLSQADALASFKTLDVNQQSQFINTVFFAELRGGGRDAINAKSASFGDYTRSERAILRMFPDFTTNTALVNQPGSLMTAFKGISSEAISNPGDLQLFYSQIRSERGGRIELLVPGGMINAGLAVSTSFQAKQASDLGVVSVRGGELNAFVRNNFQVNQSRVFTLGGSDLMLYSALTDIDAGRGAKTSSATPPPVLRIKNGQVYYDYSGAVSGSGIAALTATGGSPGTVDLFAPYGEINAGEAGIRSAGNINLGASHIVGAENISAGGATTGGPVADTSGLSLSVANVTDSSGAGKSGEQMGRVAAQSEASKESFLPTLVSVEVLGLGNETPDEKKEKDKDKEKGKSI
jgi:filamentous hemagglutinin family protein